MSYLGTRKDGRPYSRNWRAEKRYFRQSESYVAYLNGQHYGSFRSSKQNPYPPGLRHDEFERGRMVDPDNLPDDYDAF